MTLRDRIWSAHPLTPGARLVLLAVERQTPEGKMEVVVNRTLLARDLEATAENVRRGLVAGEVAGLCRVRKSGVVEWVPEGLPGISPTPQAQDAPAIMPAPLPAEGGAPMSPGPQITGPWVKAQFARVWDEQYAPARYSFMPGRDDKLAATLARSLTSGDLVERMRFYLRHSDDYYARRNHPFEMFATRVNEFIAPPRRAAARQEDEYDRAERRQAARKAAR